jgi:flagellar export protein FliJ
MKRFVFKLETVLHYRIRLEGLAEHEYRRAQAELNQARERLVELQTLRLDLLRRHEVRPGAVADVGWLEMLSRCAGQLLELSERQKGIIGECEKEVARRLEAWHRCRRDAEVIRRLREKKHRLWLRESERDEQVTQDDLFIAKIVRERLT